MHADPGAFYGIQSVVAIIVQNTVIILDVRSVADFENIIIAALKIHVVDFDVAATSKGNQVVIIRSGADPRVSGLVRIDLEPSNFDVGTGRFQFLDHRFVLLPPAIIDQLQNRIGIAFENRFPPNPDSVVNHVGERSFEMNRRVFRVRRNELKSLVDLNLVIIAFTDIIPAVVAGPGDINDRRGRRECPVRVCQQDNGREEENQPLPRPDFTDMC